MAKRADVLTDAQVKALSGRGRRAVGNGLTLEILDDGRKKWLWRYRLAGKASMLTLGYYPAIGVKEAGKRLTAAKAILDRGEDPAGERKRKPAAPAAEPQKDKFRAVALEWLRTRRGRLDATYAGVIEKRLERFLFPELGHLAMAEITPPVLLSTIRKVEAEGSIGLGRRMLSAYGQIARFALADGRAGHDPSREIRDGLAPVPRETHRASLKAGELGPFMIRLAALDCEESTRLAVEFTLRTAARTAETRFAVWSEFEELDSLWPLWRIPASRMKSEREHLVPIVPQVKALLLRARAQGGTAVFPSGASRSGFMSENAMLYAMYRMGYSGKACVHGFRGTFSTMANENGWPADHIELCLAHVQGGVRAAYNSASYLKQRRELLEWWSNVLDQRRVLAPKPLE